MPYADPQIRRAKKLEWQRGDRARNPGKAAAAQRDWRRRNPDRVAAQNRRRRRENPEQARAWDAVSNALKDGRLMRAPCEVCGDPESQGHHDDYSKPLEVRWLCATHHRHEHGRAVA